MNCCGRVGRQVFLYCFFTYIKIKKFFVKYIVVRDERNV